MSGTLPVDGHSRSLVPVIEHLKTESDPNRCRSTH
jgi:hypothetical protein